jgi:hypothetical protein
MQQPRIRKRFSLALLLSIPTTFTIGILVYINLILLIPTYGIERNILTIFLYGFIAATAIFHSDAMSYIKTFLHELKHTALVVLTGNSMKNFMVKKHTGHVTYAIRYDKIHMEPFIILAPYCFPLLSLPAYIAFHIVPIEHMIFTTIALGATLGIDMLTAIQDLHPYQTDLKSIRGGFLVSGSYIAGIHILWTSLVLHSVLIGKSSLMQIGYFLFSVIKSCYFIMIS